MIKLALRILWISLISFTAPAGPQSSTGRTSILLLPLANQTGDVKLGHWSIVADSIVTDAIKCEGTFVMPESTAAYGCNILKIDPSAFVDVVTARRLGALTGADCVIAGAFEKADQKWKLTLSQTWTLSNTPQQNIEVTFERWSELPAGFQPELEQKLRIMCKGSRQQRQRFSESEDALDWTSLAVEKLNQGKSLEEGGAWLLRALDADPKFVVTLQALAALRLMQANTDEAIYFARKAVKSDTNSALAHSALGSAYLANGMRRLAEEEMLRARELDPDRPNTYTRIVQLFAVQGRWSEALSGLQKLTQIAPYDATARAWLGRAYAQLNREKEAVEQLNQARIYNRSRDLAVYETMASSYEVLGLFPEAIECYQDYVSKARSIGLPESAISQARKHSDSLQERLLSHYIDARPPKPANSEEVGGLMKSLLTDSERSLAAAPLACTEQMTNWARQTVAGNHDLHERAKALFTAVSLRTGPGHPFRTARESFDAMADNSSTFYCQDLALLYIALARAVGIESYYALVSRDNRGTLISHACAVVFIEGRALLVDPTLRWFGVPHQEFEIENDLRAAAIFLAGTRDLKKEDVALKLAQNWPTVAFFVGISRMERHLEYLAKDSIREALKVDHTSGLALYAQGLLEASSENWGVAATNLKACLEHLPDEPGIRYQLAVVLFARGDLQEAAAEVRKFIEATDDTHEKGKGIKLLDEISASARSQLFPPSDH